MAIWAQVEAAATQPSTVPTVVTIGTFDGVHRGHRTLLDRARQVADERGLPVVAVTFARHPVAVFAPDRVPAQLTGIERRVELLTAAGADEVRALDFDREMAAWSPQEFAERVLVGQLRAVHVVVGSNFTYGTKASGDVACLRDFGREHAIGVDGLELAGGDEAYSSTLIRHLVTSGDVAGAAEVLGRPPEVTGVVVTGERRGRELGFPTANVPVPDGIACPPDGVYATWLVHTCTGERWPAATSVGDNPTFAGATHRVEAHVLDRTDLDLYGARVRVEFVERLRPMEAFESVEALVMQMHTDVRRTRDLLIS